MSLTFSRAQIRQPTDDRTIACLERRFSRFAVSNKVYLIPIDQIDEESLFEGLDGLLNTYFDHEDAIAPFPPVRLDAGDEDNSDSLPTVLDCGFGGGGWIDRMLAEHPDGLDITGVDLILSEGDTNGSDDDSDERDFSPVQEFTKKRWNLNASFQGDRSEDRLRRESFDLINSRYLAEGIDNARWPQYVRELHALLKPGGWLQMVEIQLPFQSDIRPAQPTPYMTEWWQRCSLALARIRRNHRIGDQLQDLLRRANFAQVHYAKHRLPVGEWDTTCMELGRQNIGIAERMLTSFSLFLLLQIPGFDQMSVSEYNSLIEGARSELRDPQRRLFYHIHVVYGQRSTQ